MSRPTDGKLLRKLLKKSLHEVHFTDRLAQPKRTRLSSLRRLLSPLNPRSWKGNAPLEERNEAPQQTDHGLMPGVTAGTALSSSSGNGQSIVCFTKSSQRTYQLRYGFEPLHN